MTYTKKLWAPESKREVAASRAEARKLGEACAELARQNLKVERERYWDRATCGGKERTYGVPDPEAPLRRALRWSEPETFVTQNRHWVDGWPAWIGDGSTFASFFGLGIEFGPNKRGKNKNRPIRFLMLVDDGDKTENPTPRGFLVAFDSRAYVLSARGFARASLVKQFSKWDRS